MTTTTLSGAGRLGRAGGVMNLVAVLSALRTIQARQMARYQLAHMDERLLADIGISREQALAEAAKPFWRR
jgi:uncharacterized protein YjiS (DUF1127 family)